MVITDGSPHGYVLYNIEALSPPETITVMNVSLQKHARTAYLIFITGRTQVPGCMQGCESGHFLVLYVYASNKSLLVYRVYQSCLSSAI